MAARTIAVVNWICQMFQKRCAAQYELPSFNMSPLISPPEIFSKLRRRIDLMLQTDAKTRARQRAQFRIVNQSFNGARDAVFVYILPDEISFFFDLQYNIKKREEVQEMMPQEEPNPLMRKKKTPEELAAEAEAEDEDEFTST